MPINNHKPISKRANDPSPHILRSQAILPATSSNFQLPLLQAIGRNLSAQKPIKIFQKANPPFCNTIYCKRIAKGGLGLLFSLIVAQQVTRMKKGLDSRRSRAWFVNLRGNDIWTALHTGHGAPCRYECMIRVTRSLGIGWKEKCHEYCTHKKRRLMQSRLSIA